MSDERGTAAGVLSREQLRALIGASPPLIEGWSDLDAQIQPNGFDLSLAEVSRFAGAGTLAAADAGRVLPGLEPLAFDADGFVELPAGAYQIKLQEIVNLPNDLMALGRPRSSLNRCGATIHTAVWDAGYHGRSTALLVVANPAGFRLQRGSRVLQLVFLRLAAGTREGYRGAYQGENLARG